MFDVASAHDGCTVKPATDLAGGAPLARGADDVSDPPDEDIPDTGPAPRGSIRWWYRHLRRPLLALAVLLPVPALVVIARRRRGRGSPR